jgi:hypothetical protein
MPAERPPAKRWYLSPAPWVIAGLTLALLVAVGLSALLLFPPGPRPNPDDRPPGPYAEYGGPFRNVSASVHYVPDGQCAECHADIAASYAGHPMARSLMPVAQGPAHPAGQAQNNPFDALGSRFLVRDDGDRLRHVRMRLSPAGAPAAELDWDVHYVIGSGARGHSYVSDRDGYLFLTPISWYSQKKAWDLSPGFGTQELTGRAIRHECLFCHANRAVNVDGTTNRYAAPVFDGCAIGCQRCHGPGELHVAGPGAGKGADGIDPTIVNPRHLAADLRQAVCEQCHLVGSFRVPARGRGMYDFRPGLPLEAFWSVFVPAPDAGEGSRAVGQVEQLYESRCFQAGAAAPAGRLGCTSCHDPHAHVPAARRVEHYRARCLACHEQKGCSVPVADRLRESAQDSCIQCHMPRYSASDIPHTAVTDHRIIRPGKPAAQPKEPPAPGDVYPVVSFYRGRKGVDPGEDERCRAISLIKMTLQGDPPAGRAARYVVPALEAALKRDPGDLAAGDALGYALGMQERPPEALAAFQAVLAKAPDRESPLVGAALTAEALGKPDVALGFWSRAVAVNPWAPGYHQGVVHQLLKKEAWAAALPECDAWLRVDPMSTEARAARVSCLLATGNKVEARAEFARIEALAPPNLRELQIRFAKKLK